MSEQNKTTPVDAKLSKAPAPVEAGYTNPAFRMMGIKRIKLPSRNWMIFWGVLATVGGGIAYDKYEQKQLRKVYMSRVAHLGNEPMAVSTLPRKLTVFIAPPPSDFLDESLKIFRKYMKPVLNAAAVDFEIVTESRQGEIRYRVAEDIRQLRRKLKNEAVIEDPLQKKKDDAAEVVHARSVFHWSDNTKSAWEKQPRVTDEDGNVVESRLTQTLSPLSVLGINYKSMLERDIIPKLKSEDEAVVSPQAAGGVIIIGRGAYKEYLTGLHEGLLGPLDAPPVPEPPITPEPADGDQANKDKEPSATDSDEIKKTDNDENDDDDDEPRVKVPLPYISPKEYAQAQIAPELADGLNRNIQFYLKEHRPAYFQQPIYVVRSFSLVGFLNLPRRIYRFYTQREQATYYHDAVSTVVVGREQENLRPFDKTRDLQWCADEEADWPKKWVETGKEKNSLWCSELHADDRVIEHLYVYNKK